MGMLNPDDPENPTEIHSPERVDAAGPTKIPDCLIKDSGQISDDELDEYSFLYARIGEQDFVVCRHPAIGIDICVPKEFILEGKVRHEPDAIWAAYRQADERVRFSRMIGEDPLYRRTPPG